MIRKTRTKQLIRRKTAIGPNLNYFWYKYYLHGLSSTITALTRKLFKFCNWPNQQTEKNSKNTLVHICRTFSFETSIVLYHHVNLDIPAAKITSNLREITDKRITWINHVFIRSMYFQNYEAERRQIDFQSEPYSQESIRRLQVDNHNECAQTKAISGYWNYNLYGLAE